MYLKKFPFFITLFLCFKLSSCSLGGNEKKESHGPRIHNTATIFIDYWNKVESLPIEHKLQQFKSLVVPHFPTFYAYKKMKWENQGKVANNEFKKHLEEYPKLKKEFEIKNEQISKSLENSLVTFREHFPDLNPDFDIYIAHSFGEMDGGTRQIGEDWYFILGIDGMVNYHKGIQNEVPFFHHELFHVLHSQYFKEEQVIWVALWAEGLATYVSEKLNPNASIEDLMLGQDLVRDVNKSLDKHWINLHSNLESTTDKDYETYFLVSSKNPSIVKRAGYYLGYLLAKEVGKTKTINEMAKMSKSEVLPLIQKTIKTLQTSP